MGAYDGTRPLACHRIQGIIGALPLRVRYFSRRECPRGTWFSVMPCRTFCCRIDATILHLHYRSLPRLLASLLTSCRPQVGALPHRPLYRVAQALSRGSVTRLGALATPSRVPLMPRTSRWPR